MAVDGSSNDMPTADAFAEALITRVAEARVSLAEAAATADSHAVAEALDELEEALRLARESGVTVPRAEQTTEGRAGG
jgi:hypothetical protein